MHSRAASLTCIRRSFRSSPDAKRGSRPWPREKRLRVARSIMSMPVLIAAKSSRSDQCQFLGEQLGKGKRPGRDRERKLSRKEFQPERLRMRAQARRRDTDHRSGLCGAARAQVAGPGDAGIARPRSKIRARLKSEPAASRAASFTDHRGKKLAFRKLNSFVQARWSVVRQNWHLAAAR